MSDLTVYFKNGSKDIFGNISDFSVYKYSITNKGMISFDYHNRELNCKAYATLRTETIQYYLISDLESLCPVIEDAVNVLSEPPLMKVHIDNMDADNNDLQVYFQNGSRKTFRGLYLCGRSTGSITDKESLLFTYNKGTYLGNIYLDEIIYYVVVRKKEY